MTGQQWAVVADRDKGDHPTTDDIYEGDRYTMQANRGPVFTDQLVRIERQVPTTDEPGEQFTPSTEQVRSHYVFDQSDRWDSERGAAFDRWLASVASPHPPTREQIAEAVEGAKKLVAWMDKIDADAFSYSPELGEEPPQHCVTHAEWQELLHMTDWVDTLALIQNGAER